MADALLQIEIACPAGLSFQPMWRVRALSKQCAFLAAFVYIFLDIFRGFLCSEVCLHIALCSIVPSLFLERTYFHNQRMRWELSALVSNQIFFVHRGESAQLFLCVLFYSNNEHSIFSSSILRLAVVRRSLHCNVRRLLLRSSHLLLTSSTARRITSASVMPSLRACLVIQACCEAVRTIWRWMPLVMISPFKANNEANINVYCEAVKC